MGPALVEGHGSGGETEGSLRFLVDCGASCSPRPRQTWRPPDPEHYPEHYREEQFALAGGAAIIRSVSCCRSALPQAEGCTPAPLGEPGDNQALPGAVPLETSGLSPHPFNPARLPLRLPWPS